MLADVCWQRFALIGGTNWRLAPTDFYADCQLKSALVGRCVFNIIKLSTHLLRSRRKLSRPTAVCRCVLTFKPTVRLIPPINADSNVESTVNVSRQSALYKDVSSIGCISVL